MILTKEQINRYLRHIIIPEISGPGQKKITENKVFIFASDVQGASSLLYYLAASGTGYISCCFKDNRGYETLFDNVKDLNKDVVVKVESIKLCLNAGTILEEPLYFDLLNMEFQREDGKGGSINAVDLLRNTLSETLNASSEKHYNRKKLSDSKVLIVGTGGLGSPAAYALSTVGIGTIGLVDYDTVEISNLNRQVLHSTSRIGMPKAESAKIFIKNLNPEINVITYNTSLNVDNVMDIISEYDVIVDGVDNFPSRYLLNDACFFTRKPLLDAAAVRFFGLNLTILPGVGPCYRCTFPIMPEQSAGMRCSEVGVLGPVPGVMGFIEAAEVVKLLSGEGNLLSNRIIYYDAMDSEFNVINIEKSPDCKLCSTNPTITILSEYENTCERN